MLFTSRGMVLDDAKQETNMRISPTVAQTHPRFYRYIVADMAALAGDRIMIEAVSMYGRMSKEQARQVFYFGSGPEIKIVDLDKIVIEGKEISEGPNEIITDETFVTMYEKDAEIVLTGYGKRVHRLGMYIISALVTKRAGPAAGAALERNLYGPSPAGGYKPASKAA